MQPTFKHVPPNVPLDSTQTVFSPSWAALIADTYPPGPPPITHTSYSSCVGSVLVVSVLLLVDIASLPTGDLVRANNIFRVIMLFVVFVFYFVENVSGESAMVHAPMNAIRRDHEDKMVTSSC